MTHRYVFTRMSSNKKLGGIPATISSNDTCPDACSFRGNGTQLDAKGMNTLISANRGRKGFGYTHYSPLDLHNAELIRRANAEGLTVNVSAETLEQADLYVAAGVGPVVVVLPIDATESLKTPNGNAVIVCPASIGDTTCALCALCQVPARKAIIGFPAHGIGKAKAQAVFWAKPAQV